MKNLKKILIVALLIFSVFLVSCKKCGKDKGDENEIIKVDVPLDKNGNPAYTKPNKIAITNEEDKDDVVKKFLRIMCAVENPLKNNDYIDEQSQKEFMNADSYLKEKIVYTFEESGITKEKLENIEPLIINNRTSIYYFMQLLNSGDTKVVEESEFSKLISFLDSFMRHITKEQASMFITCITLDDLISDEVDLVIEIGIPNVVETKQNIIDKFKNITNKITFEHCDKDNPVNKFQLNTLYVDMLYRIVGAINSMDINEARAGLKTVAYMMADNTDGLGLNLKENIKALGKLLDNIMSKITTEFLRVLYKKIEDQTGTKYEKAYSLNIPIFIESKNLYKIRPIFEIFVNITQDDEILSKISEYVEKLIDEVEDEDYASFMLYIYEVFVNQFEKLDEESRNMLESFINESVPSTINYELKEEIGIIKGVLNDKSNSNQTNLDKLTTLTDKISAYLKNITSAGLEYYPQTTNVPLVKKGIDKDTLYEKIKYHVTHSVYYTDGNLSYKNININQFEIDSFDTSSVGYNKARIKFHDYAKDETYYIDVNYYVYDTVDEFDATFTMDRYIQTFVFAKEDPKTPLTIGKLNEPRFNLYLKYTNKATNSDLYLNEWVNYNDVTFYNVDASNLGPHFTYASYNSETLGLIYFPVCYVVIPTESNVITDIVLERNYTTLLREDMTKEHVFMAIYVREYYVYAMKVNETDEHYYYFRTDRVDVKGYGIDNIVKYEIKDGYLYVTINHKGRIVEDKFNLQY